LAGKKVYCCRGGGIGMTNDPGKSIVALPSPLRDRIVALTENMDVDLGAEIDGDVALTINGWTILAHPLFLDQLENLTGAVEALKKKKPDQYQKNASTKLLEAFNKLVFQTIPSDPAATIYRQGSTLDAWRRLQALVSGKGR
jgi:hypothetical protein